ELEPLAVACASQESVRHLNQDTGAIPGVGFAAAGAAVFEVEQDLDGLLDDGMRFAPREVNDEADAAGIVLVLRVVQTLGERGCVSAPSIHRVSAPSIHRVSAPNGRMSHGTAVLGRREFPLRRRGAPLPREPPGEPGAAGTASATAAAPLPSAPGS